MDAYPTEEQRAGAAEAGETWVFYPNDLPKRSAYSGDTRWALAPFLAHQVSMACCTPFPSSTIYSRGAYEFGEASALSPMTLYMLAAVDVMAR